MNTTKITDTDSEERAASAFEDAGYRLAGTIEQREQSESPDGHDHE